VCINNATFDSTTPFPPPITTLYQLGKGGKYIIISLMPYKEYYLPLFNFLRGDNLVMLTTV